MKTIVITAPAPVVSLAEAKAQLRIEFDDHDTEISGFVETATAKLDGPLGCLALALGLQTLKTTLRGVPPSPFMLPIAPARTIEEVTYIASDGSKQVLPDDKYSLTADNEFELAWGATWPTVQHERAPVEITFTAGHDAIPSLLRSAILIMTGELYATRDTGQGVNVPEALVESFRFRRV